MSPFFYLRPCAAAVALCCAYPYAYAADTHTPPTKLFDPLVVTSVKPNQTPLHFVTDPKQPRQPLPASDGSDYLSTIAGFSAIRNGGSNGDPIFRGMFGSRLAILANNSYMPGACPSRMDNPTSYISPQNFDELEVIKGPQTVLWGPGASAGTIRFDRKAPVFDEGQPVQFDGSLTGGSWGRNDQSADLAVGNSQYYARITANNSHSQDYEDGNADKVPSKWKKWNTDVAVGLTPNDDTRIELSAGAGDGEARYAGRGMDGVKFKRQSVALRFEQENLNDNWHKVEAQVYYNYADHDMDNFSLREFSPSGGMKMPMTSNVDRATWGGRLATQFSLSDDVKMDVGLDTQRSRHRARRGMLNTHRDKPRVKDAQFENTGVFSELHWQTTDTQKIIAGMRVDFASVKDYREASLTHNQRRTDTLYSGFLRLEQKLGDSTSFYAGLGHVQRMPDYWELFSPNMGTPGSKNAFDSIKPEKTTQVDIGLQHKTDAWDIWASAYVGHVQDFILFNYRTGGMMGSMSQVSNVNARIFGGELGVEYALSSEWKLGTTVAYSWGKNTSDHQALPQIPPLETRLSLGYESGKWSAGALWRIVSRQSRYALNQGNVVGKDFGPSNGFSTLALHTAYQANKNLTFSVGVDNVFNRTYSEHLNLAGNAGFGYASNTSINNPGRTFWATMRVTF
ncbi:TonB-dependent copper receptor [Paenalcaligenes sp. Me52]|uniref:TonB-dependent copper receptor n=1 Tax=Paenalcaligenes sp. Me52 TaxID=3392038 RepID=UPI003D29C0A3